ncbi:helix-turn-helix domain-containing protein [Sporomusa acidovorans]|uniref:Helix-turn-helix domain-containing protein n=1 Tax=Sporomusa acidovorans (strain ATCC 49682 / DSM 3132 / Mol) TaxID=1123286 RepID=A0ABZ3IYT1_SPOA4|nr:helix-turn-helix domain-containing protein [Sporomusa acidovorans]OZC22089.1 helix-turn-helix domain protein [Sporomusa acidovorans DSM 3132]SDF66153.1 DNA binding domain-containing protein, excisionase family [Sporomusa acidovorans]
MKYYTVREIADMLKLTERGIQKWIRDGEIVAYKMGREYRIEEKDFQVFMENRKNVK